jgi:hypothetical protein
MEVLGMVRGLGLYRLSGGGWRGCTERILKLLAAWETESQLSSMHFPDIGCKWRGDLSFPKYHRYHASMDCKKSLVVYPLDLNKGVL